MTKKLLAILLLFFFIGTSLAQARDDKKLGLGVMAGEPNGASAKFWFSNAIAADAGVGYSLIGENGVQVHGDFLYHLFEIIDIRKGELPIYAGIGGRVKFQNDNKFGIRLPVGLNYIFENAPVDIFIEAVPIIDLAPDAGIDFNGVVGARFYIF